MATVKPEWVPFEEVVCRNSFIVEDFQRNYCWKERDISNFIDDAIARRNPIGNSHCMGVIIAQFSRDAGGGTPTLSLVDGQQRVSTMILAISALKSLSEKFALKKDLHPRSRRILYHPYTIDYPGDHERTKAFTDGCKGVRYKSYPYFNAYRICRDKLQRYLSIDGEPKAADIEDKLDGLCECHVVLLAPESVSDPYALFSAINGSGVPLKPHELLKCHAIAKCQSNADRLSTSSQWSRIFKYAVAHGKSTIDAWHVLHTGTKPKAQKAHEQLCTLFDRIQKGRGGSSVVKEIANISALTRQLFTGEGIVSSQKAWNHTANPLWISSVIKAMVFLRTKEVATLLYAVKKRCNDAIFNRVLSALSRSAFRLVLDGRATKSDLPRFLQTHAHNFFEKRGNALRAFFAGLNKLLATYS